VDPERVRPQERFPRVVTLDELRATPGLEKMLVINKSRLSVQPVTEEEYAIVVRLGRGGKECCAEC
jgi:predicted RNA-binding protein with PUA-like domain